jgi:cytochrome c oxidase assembly protein subunit 15
MTSGLRNDSSSNVSKWLFAGVLMIMVQILLGGITRLTQSGLSITEWNPITGILPPLNSSQWIQEFDKYKHTDQFRYIHSNFSLSDFKFIYFWEWFHRLWARLMGLVFLIGFFYFLIKKQFRRDMILPLIILFLLGILQGAIGWIMVKSGLVPEKLFVGHIQLATHFMAALLLFCYTWWFALSLSVNTSQITINKGLRNLTKAILAMLFFQLIYGAFMAGLHAASAAPTWPQINGQWVPDLINNLSPWWKNLIYNKISIQFIHRGIGYILFAGVVTWYLKALKINGTGLLKKTRLIPLVIIILQVVLGITTVVTSPYGSNLLWFGVVHQLVAILFLGSMVFMLFIVRE